LYFEPTQLYNNAILQVLELVELKGMIQLTIAFGENYCKNLALWLVWKVLQPSFGVKPRLD
jgi:hypothetical protein